MASLAMSCKEEAPKPEEPPLARVYDQYLYPSDLPMQLGDNATKDDTVRVGAFIDNWAQNKLMVRIAQDNIPNDANIEQKVQAYRASLIQHYYEQALVSQKLDSVVTNEEITAFYNQTKEEHILKESIARCYFMKIPTTAPNIEEVKTWWQMKDPLDIERLRDYCANFAQFYILEDSSWVNKSDLAAQLPDNTFSQGVFQSGKTWTSTKDEVLYFLKINDIISSGKIAPQSYVKEKAIR